VCFVGRSGASLIGLQTHSKEHCGVAHEYFSMGRSTQLRIATGGIEPKWTGHRWEIQNSSGSRPRDRPQCHCCNIRHFSLPIAAGRSLRRVTAYCVINQTSNLWRHLRCDQKCAFQTAVYSPRPEPGRSWSSIELITKERAHLKLMQDTVVRCLGRDQKYERRHIFA
jgi:hypothetical protein